MGCSISLSAMAITGKSYLSRRSCSAAMNLHTASCIVWSLGILTGMLPPSSTYSVYPLNRLFYVIKPRPLNTRLRALSGTCPRTHAAFRDGQTEWLHAALQSASPFYSQLV